MNSKNPKQSLRESGHPNLVALTSRHQQKSKHCPFNSISCSLLVQLLAHDYYNFIVTVTILLLYHLFSYVYIFA